MSSSDNSKVINPKQWTIALDYDDTTAMLNGPLLKKINEEEHTNFDIKNIKSFNFDEGSLKYRLKYYNDPDYIRSLPMFPGAFENIQLLRKKYDVFFVTAVYPPCMSARVASIKENFPDFPEDHILIGAAKNLVQVDFLLDDRSENIKNSIAKYPILFRQPWNEDISGMLTVNNFEDFVHIVDTISGSYNETLNMENGGIICFVGPSGSGKTAIMKELTSSDDRFIKPITTTTRPRRPGETSKDYHFVSKPAFMQDLENGKFLETTVYSGNYYGTTPSSINSVIDNGKYAILPIDICGAMALKNEYRQRCMIVFIDRDKSLVVEEIINRPVSNQEKAKRIVSLDWEYKNKSFCDVIIENNGTVKSAVRAIKKVIKEGTL